MERKGPLELLRPWKHAFPKSALRGFCCPILTYSNESTFNLTARSQPWEANVCKLERRHLHFPDYWQVQWGAQNNYIFDDPLLCPCPVSRVTLRWRMFVRAIVLTVFRFRIFLHYGGHDLCKKNFEKQFLDSNFNFHKTSVVTFWNIQLCKLSPSARNKTRH